MLTVLILVFVLAYAAIALEHPLHINKSASALLGAGLLWTIYAMGQGDPTTVSRQLGESLMGTAQIVFFLMGAMTIVEVVDAHNGFEVITSRIKTTKLSTLMWMVGLLHQRHHHDRGGQVVQNGAEKEGHETDHPHQGGQLGGLDAL